VIYLPAKIAHPEDLANMITEKTGIKVVPGTNIDKT
jgi:hypothetical protein